MQTADFSLESLAFFCRLVVHWLVDKFLHSSFKSTEMFFFIILVKLLLWLLIFSICIFNQAFLALSYFLYFNTN